MSNSSLVTYTKLSPNCSTRTAPISKITIHHMAVVNGTLSGMGDWFSRSSTKASSNYGIDSKGNVALYVDESKRSWCSSNTANDNVAVTIEVANSKGDPNWEVSDAAYARLIDLCVDICQRNGIKELVYTGDKNGNLTRHDMFYAKICPGPYLGSKFPDIAKQVNARLKNGDFAPTDIPTATPNDGSLRVGSAGDDVNKLQRNLNGLNYNCGTVDGSFGEKTEAAVKAFQKAYSLTQDGIAGPVTLKKIDEVVKDVQTKLNAKGFNCGTPDGSYGPKTKEAVTKFQTANKLYVDGIAGAKTLAALNKTEEKKEEVKPQGEYKIKVTASVLNIRQGPGTNYAICGQIKDKGVYTIVETKGDWGKLKSGAGWIFMEYTKKI